MNPTKGMTPEKIKRWIKQGRGQGDLKNYKPWLTHRDVPSNGWRIRIQGLVTGRTHALFSKEEAKVFRPLDLSPWTQDIKEQFPLLPLEMTLAIAKNLGVKHPEDPGTKHSIVMTTDFLWCIEGKQIPIDSKPSAKLVTPRVIEKFEIARAYWKLRDLTWRLSTELEIPDVLTENCSRFHGNFFLDGLEITVRDIKDAARLMPEQVIQQERPIRLIARDTDEQLGLKPGTCLRMAFHFMARRYWEVDWYVPQEAESIINLLEYHKDFDFSKSFRQPSGEG